MAAIPWVTRIMSSIINAPALDGKVVSRSDSVDLPDGPCRAVNVNVAGLVKVTTYLGTDVTYFMVPGNNSMACKRIWSTGTDIAITNIVALY